MKKINFCALIPARKGSKRLKNKNTKTFNKKKLIEWTFSAAKKAKKISEIYISTNDEKILPLAKKWKIKIPFKRPEFLSDDKITTDEVVLHFLEWSKNNNIFIKYLVVLQPTSPLRTFEDIDKACKIISSNKSENLISLSKIPFNVNHLTDISKNYFRKADIQNNFKKDNFNFINGAIYIIDVEVFYKSKSLFLKKNSYFTMPFERSIDIDTLDDFRLAGKLI